MRNKLIYYYLNSFITPGNTFNEFKADSKNFKYSFIYMLIPITGYTLMYIMLTIGNGAPSVFTPWLNISKEEYYSINRFLVAPSFILSWFFASAVIHVLSRILDGKGTFDDMLALIGLSTSIAMWGTLLHDLIMSFLSALRVIDAKQHEIAMNSPTVWRIVLWISIIIYLIYFLTLFSKSVSAVHKFSKLKSFFIGLVGFICFQLIFLIFNR